LEEYGDSTSDVNLIFKHPDEINLVVYPGGSDIHPSLYKHEKHNLTFCNLQRDKRDVSVFKQALKHNIPIIGICRGAQFLTAMAGGYLYQDTSGHNMNHTIETDDGRTFMVTSSHHQMFGMPLVPGAKLLSWSKERKSAYYDTDMFNVEPPEVEPESVFYPSIGSLAVQWHPEWMDEEADGVAYYKELVQTYVDPLISKRHNEIIAQGHYIEV